MGFTITAVCTVTAYSYTLTQYYGTSSFGDTAIVNGGNCSLTLGDFTDDAGSYIEVFNITTPGQMQLENIRCNITSNSGCNTNYLPFNGYPYESQTFDFLTYNVTGTYNAVNWTYYIVPPVPSQPTTPMLVSGNTSVSYNTSMYSTEYGSPLIGCLISAGPTPYNPANIPTTLSSTPSQNTLPFTSAASYTSSQNTPVTVSLASMNLAPNVAYDFWTVCYNSNGATYPIKLFNQTTSSSLPTPAVYVSSSSSTASTPVSTASSSSTGSTPGKLNSATAASASLLAVAVAALSVVALMA